MADLNPCIITIIGRGNEEGNLINVAGIGSKISLSAAGTLEKRDCQEEKAATRQPFFLPLGKNYKVVIPREK